MPLIGNTIRLKAEFRNFNGELFDIENPKVVVYNNKRKVILDAEPERIEKGKYQYDYVIPEVFGQLYFEFRGTIRGLPILGRATIDKRWI